MIFDRNPHYWRRTEGGEPLPYLDRLVIEIVPDQNTELLRLQAGEIDMTSYELRPDDYVTVKRAADEGRIRLVELGIGADPDAFWFCLKPEARRKDPKFAFVQKREFRQAIAHAVDREQFANVVYLGAAVPVWGPITPGNKPWYWPDVPKYPYDPARARALLKSIGLEDRNGNGTMEDAKGTEARFTVITQRGITSYERATALLRDELAKIGIALDIVPLEFGAMIQRMTSSDYEAIYMRVLATALDPAMNKDLWLSSGSFHYWNLEQKTPATEWERRIDTLMLEQAATTDAARRREIFNEVQRIFAENLPALHFVAPRIYAAHSARVEGVTPSIMRPPLLWNPDTIRVRGPNSKSQ
jgi:peptide/nickel transport system substrate-binding protein